MIQDMKHKGGNDTDYFEEVKQILVKMRNDLQKWRNVF